MPTRHVGENDVESVRAREKGTWIMVKLWKEEKKTRRRTSCRMKGWKSLQPVSERFVPGQSIKNVSRAEIIKVRISDRRQGARKGDVWCKETSEGGDREWVECRKRVDVADVWNIPPSDSRLAMGNLYWFVPVDCGAYMGSGSIWFLCLALRVGCSHVLYTSWAHIYTYRQSLILLRLCRTFDIICRKSWDILQEKLVLYKYY